MVLQSAVLALAVHQHEARGVPQLVAEIAVTLAAAQIEIQRAREGRKRCEGEAQRIGAEGRECLRVILAHVFLDLLLVLGAQQTDRGLRNQVFESDAVDQVQRIEGVALRLRHFLAFGIAHDGVDVDMRGMGTLPVKCRVIMIIRATQKKMMSKPVTSTEEGRNVSRSRVLLRPAERGERHQRRGKPGVEDVLVAT